MKRFAAHYLFLPGDKRYKLHSVELDETNRLTEINLLDKEIAATSFFNGIVLIVNKHTFSSPTDLAELLEDTLQQFPETPALEWMERLPLKPINKEQPVELYHLGGIDFLPAKFRTDNGGRHCHVQRLC
jgi:hypothetical protein